MSASSIMDNVITTVIILLVLIIAPAKLDINCNLIATNV